VEILSEDRSLRILTRMAWQIYEQHQGSPDLVLAGIRERGFRVAEKLAEELSTLRPWKFICKLLPSISNNPVLIPLQH
jgi:pyrimidine operon attenuation protein/uracil phosphoribosyltransferase